MASERKNFFGLALTGILFCLVEWGAGKPRTYLVETKDKHIPNIQPIGVVDFEQPIEFGADYSNDDIEEVDTPIELEGLPPITMDQIPDLPKKLVDVMEEIMLELDDGQLVERLHEALKNNDHKAFQEMSNDAYEIVNNLDPEKLEELHQKYRDAMEKIMGAPLPAPEINPDMDPEELKELTRKYRDMMEKIVGAPLPEYTVEYTDGTDYNNDEETAKEDDTKAVINEKKLLEWLEDSYNSMKSASTSEREEMIKKIQAEADTYFDEFGVSELYREDLRQAIKEVNADNVVDVLKGAVKIVNPDFEE